MAEYRRMVEKEETLIEDISLIAKTIVLNKIEKEIDASIKKKKAKQDEKEDVIEKKNEDGENNADEEDQEPPHVRWTRKYDKPMLEVIFLSLIMVRIIIPNGF